MSNICTPRSTCVSMVNAESVSRPLSALTDCSPGSACGANENTGGTDGRRLLILRASDPAAASASPLPMPARAHSGNPKGTVTTRSTGAPDWTSVPAAGNCVVIVPADANANARISLRLPGRRPAACSAANACTMLVPTTSGTRTITGCVTGGGAAGGGATGGGATGGDDGGGAATTGGGTASDSDTAVPTSTCSFAAGCCASTVPRGARAICSLVRPTTRPTARSRSVASRWLLPRRSGTRTRRGVASHRYHRCIDGNLPAGLRDLLDNGAARLGGLAEPCLAGAQTVFPEDARRLELAAPEHPWNLHLNRHGERHVYRHSGACDCSRGRHLREDGAGCFFGLAIGDQPEPQPRSGEGARCAGAVQAAQIRHRRGRGRRQPDLHRRGRRHERARHWRLTENGVLGGFRGPAADVSKAQARVLEALLRRRLVDALERRYAHELRRRRRHRHPEVDICIARHHRAANRPLVDDEPGRARRLAVEHAAAVQAAAFEQRDRRLGVLPGKRRHRDGRATRRLRSRRLGWWRRWNRDRDLNRRLALDHRSGIRPLANDGSGTGGRLRAGGPAQSQPRALDLRRDVFVPGIQQVRHASPALIGLGRRRRRCRNRNPDVDAHTTVDHRSAIRMLAKDRSFAPRRRVGPNRAPDAQPRSRNLLRRLGIHVADDVWHASRARRRRYGDPEIDRHIALDDRSAIRVLPQDRSFTPRRLGAHGAPDTQPRSCNLLRRLGERIVDQIWHPSPAGRVRRRHDLNGDCDVHARVAGDDRFWVGRLRDNASSRISSRFDAAHGAEYEARPFQRGPCLALLADRGNLAPDVIAALIGAGASSASRIGRRAAAPCLSRRRAIGSAARRRLHAARIRQLVVRAGPRRPRILRNATGVRPLRARLWRTLRSASFELDGRRGGSGRRLLCRGLRRLGRGARLLRRSHGRVRGGNHYENRSDDREQPLPRCAHGPHLSQCRFLSDVTKPARGYSYGFL